MEEFDLDAITNVLPLGENFNEFKASLMNIQGHHTVTVIDASHHLIQKLEIGIFDGFENLQVLKLVGNALTDLPYGIFDSLVNLETLDLSNNILSTVSDLIFRNNFKIKTINLKNNVLNEINSRAFSYLRSLNNLNLSHNQIEKLEFFCLDNIQLQKLDLSYNQIEIIDSAAFFLMPKLFHLSLNNNKIKTLKHNTFSSTKQVEYLNLSHNFIQRLDNRTFSNMLKLLRLNLSFNSLTELRNCLFELNYKLIDLDVSNNNFVTIEQSAFNGCRNLKKLKIKTCSSYISNAFYFLKSLENLEFVSMFEEKLSCAFFKHFNFAIIRKLIIIFRKSHFKKTALINLMSNLEFLHIEFLEPTEMPVTIPFSTQFYKLPKLRNLTLKNMNALHISVSHFYLNFKTINIEYLDLTKLYNLEIDNLIHKLHLLKYLNLSNSKIVHIHEIAMQNLLHLEQLILSNSRITSISANLFIRNVNLRVLNFQNCPIQKIEDFAFAALANLQLLNLKGICLKVITANILHGIPITANIYIN